MLGLPPAEEGGVQWHIAKLRALREEMNQEDLVCPMVWIPKWVAEDICPNKLLDLFNFAPSDWDSIVCAIVIVSRGVLLGEKNYEDAEAALTECRSAMSRPQGAAAANADPLLLRYHAAMAHIVDATWVMAACLHRGLSVRAVLDSMQSSIPRVRSLGVRDQAAVAALRSLCLQIVHYTLWPSLMDERKPVFKEAMQSATCAMALAPDEGVWLTLYARCLPWSDSRKSILLQAGFNLNKTPFTVIEYATYLSHSGYAEAVDEAAKLCELAIRMWPESVFVNANYVTLFLNSNCRAKLSLATADECLRRARSLAPDSPMLAGHRWNLRDVHRAGGHLSPILEEGEDVLADVGGWSPEKEQRLLAIAACLYPSAMQQLQRLAHPVQQPGAAGAAEGAVRPDDSPKGPDTLWSPRMQKKFASPGGRSSPPSPGPSPDPAHLTSVPDPSSVEHDPSLPSNFTRPPTTIPPPTPSPSPPPTLSPSPHPTPSPSPPPSLSPTSSPPPTRLPGKPLRMRTSPISGPLRRPRTSPAARPVDAHSGVSSSSPAGTPVTPPCVNTGTSAPPPCPTPCVPLPPPEFRDAPVADPVAAAPKVSPCAPSRRSWGFPAQSPPPEAFARAKTSSPATARPAAPAQSPPPEAFARAKTSSPATARPAAPAQSPPPEAFARAKTSSPATARPAAPVKPPAPVIAVPVSQGVPAPVTVHQDFSDAVTEPSVVKDLRAAVCEPSVAQDLSPAPLMQCAPAVQDLRASVTQPCVQQDLSGAINEVSAAQDLPSATFSTPSSPVSPIVPPANVKRQRVPEGAPPLTELIPPSYFEAPQHGPPADVKPDSRLSAVELLDPAPPLRVEPASVPLPEEKTAIHFEAPPMAVSKAQARLERLVAALSSPPCKAEHGPPAGVKPDLVPPLKVEPVSVSPPESKTARSGAAPQGRLSPESVHASGGNGAPGWHKSSLRPTAPAWVPPSMRPARPASGLMPPSRPRHGGCMRPVALPTPPPSPASESAWSDFLVAQSLIQPPMEYKCPAQERFKRLKLQEPKEVKSEVQVKLGDTARDCEDYHWQAKLFDLHHTGNPAPMTNGNHCPVKLEVPSKCEHKGKNLDGFITPPFMEGAYDARKEIVLRTEKDECRSDMKRIASSARVNLNDKFSQVKTEVTASEHTKAVTISAPASRPVILICDDKSMSTIPNDLCPSNRSDSQAGVAPACPQSGESSEQPCTNASGNSNPARIRSPGPFARAAAAPGPFARAAADIGLFGPAPSRVRHASSAATSNSAQKPGLTSSERPQQVTRVVYTNCGWTNQQKPSVVAAPVSSYGQTNQQKPSVVAAPVSSCGQTNQQKPSVVAAPVSSCGQTNQQKPSVVAAPVSSCGQTNQRMPSVAAPVTSGWRSFVVAPMPSGVGVAPLRGFATPTSSLGPQPLMSMPTISFGPQPLMSVFVPAPPLPSYVMPVPAPAPNFASNSARHPAPNHWAPRQASNFAAAPPSMNFSAPRPASNFAAAPPSMNFSAPRPASNFAAAPPSMNFSAPRPASNFAASPSGSNFSTPPVANVAAPPAASSRCAAPPAASSRCASPPAASDVEASRRSVCADALAEVRGLIEEADACPRPQSPAWETVKSRRPHLAQPAGSARSRTSSPAGRFSVLSKASPTSSGHSSRATSPVRADGKADDVPLWRRGGGDADRGHWFTPSTPNPTTPSCSSTQLEPPVALRPEPVRTVPPAAALPACNCVCSSDCVSATYKYYGDLRPGPQVEKRCLKKGLLNGAPRPRLSSRLVIS